MRFTKTALAAGTFHKGGRAFHVSKDDLKVALNTYKKIRESGYKAPVIMEHSARNDKDGLPFEFKPEMSKYTARDLAKFQEGWTDDLRLNDDGELEIDIDVRGKDGLKLITEVGTYISPQFGPWIHPKTGEELPMAMTHFALTPYPVDINQNAEFKPIIDASTPVLEVSQLSQMVSFSLADMVDDSVQMGQKSFAFNDEDHPHDKSNGQFTKKGGGGSGATATEDEPFTLKRESDKKFVPKSAKGMQTDLFGKTKTTVSPADAHVKKQAESLPGQKTIEDDCKSEECHPSVARALAGTHAVHVKTPEQANQHGQDHWFNNQAAQNAFPHSGGKKGYHHFGNAVQAEFEKRLKQNKNGKSSSTTEMSHFDADAAVREKLLQMSHFDESKVNRDEVGKFAESLCCPPAKKVKKGSHKAAEKQAEVHHKEAAKATRRGDTQAARQHVAAAYGMHLAAKHYKNGDHEKGHSASAKAARFASGEIQFPDHTHESTNDSGSESTQQMGQSMPFPKQSSAPDNDQDTDNGEDFDSGDVDQDDDGIVDSYDPDLGTGAEDPATEKVQSQLPDATDAETWAQIGAALKLMGVIVPDATNAHALLAGLLTAAHHMQKADAAETADAAADHLESVQANQPPPADPNQPPPADPSQQSPVQSQQNDPRLKGTRQEQAFTMSQATAQTVKSAANAANKTQATPAVPDFKKTPEWQQMSQANEALAGELSQLKREKYLRRIEELAKSGRIDKPEADGLRSVAGTFQFSNASSSDIAEMEMELKIREKLPEGAIWSPSERIQQLSIAEETRPGFFNETGKPEASESDEDADIERRFAKFK